MSRERPTPTSSTHRVKPAPAEIADPGTRARLLASAVQLLSERGLEGTGLAALIEASGATKGSLYHFFPEGKSQWVAEALSVYSAQLRAGLDARFAKAATPGAAVAGFIEDAAKRQEQQAFQRGCPIGAVALDVAPDDPLAAHCSALFDDWVATLARHLRPGKAKEGRALAEWVIASFEGALLLSRVRRSAAPLREAAKRLRTAVDAT
jgi:TetR/AcrR family transcriptional repressor of lmrAB and yxaGH operons